VIIVTGSAVVRPDRIDDAIAVSLEHVRRSRTEPGCLAHAVHRDVEDPFRLVFVEQWADLDALHAHFRVPASVAFVEALGELTAGRPTMEIFAAEPTR
jgi:quinol monooxygenase YgiN